MIEETEVKTSSEKASHRFYTHLEKLGNELEKDVHPYRQDFDRKIDVSIIIPVSNYDDEPLIDCLDSIIKQDHNECIETIVVANGNIAQARNMGITLAQGDYLGFLDSDCTAKTSWIQTLKPCLDDDQKIGGVGCSTLSSPDSTNLDKAIDQIYGCYLGSLGSHTLTRVIENRFVKSLSGTGSLFDTHVVEEVGGFDERFEYNEDNELSHRVRETGSQLLFIPDLEIYHRRPKTITDFMKKFYNYGVGRTRSTLTCPKLFDVRVYSLLILFLFSIGLVLLNNYLGFMFATLYLLTIFGVSVYKSVEINRSDLMSLIFVLFLVEHLAYAIGLLTGLLRGPWGEPIGEPKVFLHFTVCNRDS